MKRCNFNIEKINSYYFKIVFEDKEDAIEIAEAIRVIVADRLLNITLHDSGHNDIYLEVIGINGMKQWKQYVSNYIMEDKTNTIFFILNDNFRLMQKPKQIEYKETEITVGQAKTMLKESGLSENFLKF